MANKIAEYMEITHTKFIRNSIPTKLEKSDPSGRIKVTWVNEEK